MKLSYDILISPFPFYIKGIGSIKSPTLGEIWDTKVTYPVYNLYLTYLLLNVESYTEKVNPKMAEWFNSLATEEKSEITMMDIISVDKALREEYIKMFEFFFVENVIWEEDTKMFVTYTDINEETNEIIPVGVISRDTFVHVCKIILQRCAVGDADDISEVDESKVKSKRALEILRKIKEGRKKKAQLSKADKDLELPNVISKVAVMAKSINYTNIWQLTVFQLREQFKQENVNIGFDIAKTSVAAYGNKKKTFKGDEWYKTNN